MLSVGSNHVRTKLAAYRAALTVAILLAIVNVLRSAELETAQKLFQKGDYAGCAKLCEEAMRDGETRDSWPLLLIQSLMATGRYAEALGTVTNALENNSSSIRLRLAARDVFQFNGQSERAEAMVQDINLLAGSRTWAYQEPADLVTKGQTALLLGADPKRVMTLFFDRAKKADPKCREAYLAGGELAISKGDFDLASKTLTEGLKQFEDDADMNGTMARAFAPGDRKQALAFAAVALNVNSNHVPSLLLVADHLIDAENYAGAAKLLGQVLSVNPWSPEAWACRAVLAHLTNNLVAENEARGNALRHFTNNPAVDHLIGTKLSQKYRFAEGAAAQRRALAFDANYLPAQIQLAQDLLRLGEEDAGWSLAEVVHQADGYDVEAYNLVTLKDTMTKFRTLTNAHFILRMGAKEADIYGERALELLERAREKLTAKYGLKLNRPIVVEIFPEQKDFGVRTFGIPDNPGYLGVCFGGVITANSPASQIGGQANWHAVLWHEFAHVITLNLTRNKMPRWLSEGISVYEELQANPAWGQHMNSRYREMILGDDFIPVGELSAAFLAPKTPQHLQFAYFESSLVVQFLAEKFGFEALKKVLRALGDGKPIETALSASTVPMEQFEKDFKAYARARAEGLAPGLDFGKPKDDLQAVVAEFVEENTRNSFTSLARRANKLIEEKKWQEAKQPLETLLKEYPNNIEPGNAYVLLARAHRGLGETNDERRVLTKLVRLDGAAAEPLQRLMEIDLALGDWPAMRQNAERYLAINPLVPMPHRYLGIACENLSDRRGAIRALRAQLQLDPPDPADAHYRLGKLLYATGDAEAKRQVLQALEEAPRYRDAQKLLLEIRSKTTSAPPAVNGGVTNEVEKPE